jgi:glyoxylase-like metal-dependent hydrolase (beta-lactamase superfamily II)
MSKLQPISRRNFLAAGTAGAAVVPATLFSPRRGWADVQAVHRSSDVEVWTLSDGHFLLPASFLVAKEATAAERKAVLAEESERLRMPLNVTLIRTGSDLILIDAGYGRGVTDTAGKLVAVLESMGLTSASITKVLVTHAHPDHLWGVSGDAGVTFANAAYLVSSAEWHHWTNPDVAISLPAVLRASQQASDRVVLGAQKHLARIKDKLRLVEPEHEIAAGVRVVGTPGHTPGHISVDVAGLFITGDALTHPRISFEHPSWRVPVDHDQDQGVTTRQRLLDRLATDQRRIMCAHLPFPGMGLVERKDGAYRFVAI